MTNNHLPVLFILYVPLVSTASDEIFDFPSKLIGKSNKVKIEVVDLNNNKIQQSIKKYLLHKYVV